jgi:hypothetical protein
MERIDILARLLHDKPTQSNKRCEKALSELTAISYEVVRIKRPCTLARMSWLHPRQRMPSMTSTNAS